jgi:hypothetical protein
MWKNQTHCYFKFNSILHVVTIPEAKNKNC